MHQKAIRTIKDKYQCAKVTTKTMSLLGTSVNYQPGEGTHRQTEN